MNTPQLNCKWYRFQIMHPVVDKKNAYEQTSPLSSVGRKTVAWPKLVHLGPRRKISSKLNFHPILDYWHFEMCEGASNRCLKWFDNLIHLQEHRSIYQTLFFYFKSYYILTTNVNAKKALLSYAAAAQDDFKAATQVCWIGLHKPVSKDNVDFSRLLAEQFLILVAFSGLSVFLSKFSVAFPWSTESCFVLFLLIWKLFW